jgi:drug/metabolite transporter (DMT)-like permease
MNALGPIAAFLSSVTWAFASSRYALLARSAGGEQVNLLRALFALTLWASALFVLQGPSGLSGVSLGTSAYLAASIACSYGIGDAIFFSAATRIDMSSALAIATTYPLWATLYGIAFRGEAFRGWAMVGMLVCVFGVSSLLRQSRAGTSTGASARGAAIGVGLAALASLLWAGNAVFLKLGASGLSVYQANAVRFAFGVLIILPQWGVKRARAPRGQPAPWHLKQMLLPLLADTGFGSVCYVYGIANSELAVGTTLSSLSPLVALIIGAVTKTERLTPQRVLAVCMTVAGVILLVMA